MDKIKCDCEMNEEAKKKWTKQIVIVNVAKKLILTYTRYMCSTCLIKRKKAEIIHMKY